MSKIILNSVDDLPKAAKELLKKYPDKRVFAFYGEMGAGKTTFIKNICQELGLKDGVSSPTFSLVNEYLGGSGEQIFHFDFYRIKDISEAYDMGFEEYIYKKSYCFIEWPEKVEELLPEGYIAVRITTNQAQRAIEF